MLQLSGKSFLRQAELVSASKILINLDSEINSE